MDYRFFQSTKVVGLLYIWIIIGFIGYTHAEIKTTSACVGDIISLSCTGSTIIQLKSVLSGLSEDNTRCIYQQGDCSETRSPTNNPDNIFNTLTVSCSSSFCQVVSLTEWLDNCQLPGSVTRGAASTYTVVTYECVDPDITSTETASSTTIVATTQELSTESTSQLQTAATVDTTIGETTITSQATESTTSVDTIEGYTDTTVAVTSPGGGGDGIPSPSTEGLTSTIYYENSSTISSFTVTLNQSVSTLGETSTLTTQPTAITNTTSNENTTTPEPDITASVATVNDSVTYASNGGLVTTERIVESTTTEIKSAPVKTPTNDNSWLIPVIIGGIVGGFLIILLITFIIFMAMRKRKRDRELLDSKASRGENGAPFAMKNGAYVNGASTSIPRPTTSERATSYNKKMEIDVDAIYNHHNTQTDNKPQINGIQNGVNKSNMAATSGMGEARVTVRSHTNDELPNTKSNNNSNTRPQSTGGKGQHGKTVSTGIGGKNSINMTPTEEDIIYAYHQDLPTQEYYFSGELYPSHMKSNENKM